PKRQESLREPVRGEVVFEGVSFSYAAGAAADRGGHNPSKIDAAARDGRTPERLVLREVLLHALPGQMVALVGPTGAGKSTLVNLLPAFYEATSGTIKIDGRDISQLTLESLRSRIAVVSQEPFLFNGTVRENILYGKLDATE